MSRTGRLDPDALAALEEERAFLLRSLDDLEAEFEVGDIDEADYEALKDDYTRRAAEVIRAADEQRSAFRATRGINWRQAAVWLVGLAVLGGLSGVLIARSSGTRSDNDTITGGVRESEITRLNEAQRLFPDEERWDEAIEIYDSVLDDNPSSTEAITYRAWLVYRQGGPADEAIDAFEEVGRIDESYAASIVFHTIVLADEQRFDEAAEILDRLDLTSAPDEVAVIVAQRGVAGEVYGESRRDVIEGSEAPPLDQLGLDVDKALAAAGYFFGLNTGGDTVNALKLYRSVRELDPTHPAASSREAWLLFQSGLDGADELIEAAIAVHPDDPEILLTRASMAAGSDQDAACADLATLLALDDLDPGFVSLAEGLQAQICDA